MTMLSRINPGVRGASRIASEVELVEAGLERVHGEEEASPVHMKTRNVIVKCDCVVVRRAFCARVLCVIEVHLTEIVTK